MADDVVAEMQQFRRCHQNKEEDDNGDQCGCEVTASLTAGLAGRHAGRRVDHGPVSTLDAARLTQRLHKSRRAEQQYGGRK